MGNYASNQQLIDRFEDEAAVAHLTHNPDGSPDQELLTRAIDSAEGLIESYLAMRYDVPVDVSADLRLAASLRGVTLDLAQFNLMSANSLVPDSMKLIYDRVLKWLQDIAAGKAVLPAAATPNSTGARAPGLTSSFATRQFTRDNVSGL